jgi:hypothetical protein
MTTISGTLLSAPGTTLLSQLADDIQAHHLNDTAETYFTQAQVEHWLKDAIRDYSNHFPQQLTNTITTALNDRAYDLPAGFIDPISVQYDQGQDNPEYLTRHPHNDDFWSINGRYDIIPRPSTDSHEIWISTKPAADESLIIEYTAPHDHDLTSSDPITVPAAHHHILALYASWQATALLQQNEEQNPSSTSSLLMSLLAQNAQQKQKAYQAAIRELKKTAVSPPGRLRWNNGIETESIY